MIRDNSYRTIFYSTITALYYFVTLKLIFLTPMSDPFRPYIGGAMVYKHPAFHHIFIISLLWVQLLNCSFRHPTRSQFRRLPSPSERAWWTCSTLSFPKSLFNSSEIVRSSCNWIWTFLSWKWNQMPRLIQKHRNLWFLNWLNGEIGPKINVEDYTPSRHQHGLSLVSVHVTWCVTWLKYHASLPASKLLLV